MRIFSFSVILTTRHLASHLGGVRHYEKPKDDQKSEENKKKDADADEKNDPSVHKVSQNKIRM